MPKSRATLNKEIRQEALREQLANQGHVQHVVDCAKKLSSAKVSDKDIRRLKAKADIHLALIRKYIPDLKAIEVSDNSGVIDNKWQIEVVSALNQAIDQHKPDDQELETSKGKTIN